MNNKSTWTGLWCGVAEGREVWPGPQTNQRPSWPGNDDPFMLCSGRTLFYVRIARASTQYPPIANRMTCQGRALD